MLCFRRVDSGIMDADDGVETGKLAEDIHDTDITHVRWFPLKAKPSIRIP